MTEILFLLLSLLMILASAEVFTNGVESLGRRLSLSQAVVGSILAAVGTALPETILPFVAILMHGGDAAKSIGVGAILGAPFMLSTLALFLVGISVAVSFFRKKREFELLVEAPSLKRDLLFFIALYGAAILLPLFVRGHIVIALLLVAGYLVYAYRTFTGESEDIMHAQELYLRKLISLGRRQEKGAGDSPEGHGPERLFLILFQVMAALGLMVGGAHVFVGSIEKLSASWGMSPLLFALLVAPIATELPEKFNSVTWTLKGKDTLAMGNITGAMVFQSTFPVSVGLLFTEWNLSGLGILSAVLALSSALVMIAEIHFRGRISPWSLLTGGLLYLVYVAAILLSH
ncbi:MAG: sodium:calcium antiporter [Alphaproteobacteria bacterium]|uniref:Sodium:calcium antiporter n=1 Tax=Candidatus Nitrobium versatile TaxID=2884831 RepID=A0A953JBG9_9BACT|nr:sodium:calcium antiporter [Candidatus Nitrobium versatile]